MTDQAVSFEEMKRQVIEWAEVSRRNRNKNPKKVRQLTSEEVSELFLDKLLNRKKNPKNERKSKP